MNKNTYENFRSRYEENSLGDCNLPQGYIFGFKTCAI